jgi:hypothetical protein
VSVPAGVDLDALTNQLRAAGGEVSLDVTVHEAAAEDM